MFGGTGDPARRQRLQALLLVLSPALLQAAIVARFGSRMLLWDEFFYVPALREIGEGRPWLYWLWTQHNEHRIVWTKLLLFAHAGLSGWNPLVDMYASAGLTGLIAWGIWKLYRAAGAGSPAHFIPAALLLCNLAQYMNILYGLMTCHYFTLAGMIWAIVFLTLDTRAGLAAAVASAVAAGVSCVSGMLIAPIGLGVLVLREQKWTRCLAWVAAMVGFGLVYSYAYQSPSAHPMPWQSVAAIRQAADTFLICLGSPLSAGDALRSRIIGLMTVAAYAAWCLVAGPGERRRHAGLMALGGIGLACAGAVAFARAANGPTVGLESKYVTYSTLSAVAIYLGLTSLPHLPARRPLLFGINAAIGVGLVAANVVGWGQAQAWQQARHRDAYLLQTIDRQPDETLASIYFVPQLREAAAYLRAVGFGPFREKIDALMAPRWQEGRPTSLITRAALLQMRLLCPVDTLLDIGMVVSPAGGAGSVDVTVSRAGRVVGRGHLDAAGARPTAYVRVTLEAPIRSCRGTELTVEATSGATGSEGAFHAWTYPVYFAGVARQGGGVIDRASLGLAFNAFVNGFID